MEIFISHSSKDKYIIDEFVEKILLLGCGLNNKQIFCTSIEGLGIRNGSDFRKHIKNSLKSCTYSFIMVSNNYKESDLDELFEELTSVFNTEKNIVRWNKHKNDFIKIVNKKKYSNKETKDITTDFFGKFLKENISLNHLLLNCHPTLLDCKKIFSKDYYHKYFELYCHQFEKLENEIIEPLFPKYSTFKISKNNTEELISGKSKLAGGMSQIAKKGHLNYGVDFYKVTFLENENSEFGLSYNVFCYVNNHWVFIPKPWRYE